MKLTAVVKLLPTDEQRQNLLQTLEHANAACNHASRVAWETKQFSQVNLHHATYYDLRETYALTAQMAVRCIGKVSDAYKKDRKVKRTFKPHGAVAYDSRILNWRVPDKQVSIWVLGGRIVIDFVTGAHYLALLLYQHGETDLVFRSGKFYLFTTCDVPEADLIDPDDMLGIDLGVVNIATDSDRTFHNGEAVNPVRYRHRSLRTKLQRKGTKAAKRRLKKLAGKERRFANHVNHCISKTIVAVAQGTGRGIALENLKGIRDRITARKRQRATLVSWSFDDLQHKIAYKAQRVGLPVVYVDPRNTSRTCPVCGGVDKGNRKSQSKFLCINVDCGFSEHADYVAALNIRVRGRAAVSLPDISTAQNTALRQG